MVPHLHRSIAVFDSVVKIMGLQSIHHIPRFTRRKTHLRPDSAQRTAELELRFSKDFSKDSEQSLVETGLRVFAVACVPVRPRRPPVQRALVAFLLSAVGWSQTVGGSAPTKTWVNGTEEWALWQALMKECSRPRPKEAAALPMNHGHWRPRAQSLLGLPWIWMSSRFEPPEDLQPESDRVLLFYE